MMCCIVIPVYKDKLTEFEIISLKQCCVILGKYPIIFVTHKDLNQTVYNTICDEKKISYKYEYFNKKYFINISGYNALLLSKKFYKKFDNYEYMLIYQLDAYVFRDELEYWCKKGYDYIGAPWIRLNISRTIPEFYDPPAVGNGGFSLRNIKRLIAIHNVSMSIISFFHLFKSYYKRMLSKSKKNVFYIFPIFFSCIVILILKIISYKKYILDSEDEIWTRLLHGKSRLPPVMDAVKFSFENFPEYLYKLNNEKLPFGCHDWYKYYNYFFFRKYIT
jgi:hypothetical protein